MGGGSRKDSPDVPHDLEVFAGRDHASADLRSVTGQVAVVCGGLIAGVVDVHAEEAGSVGRLGSDGGRACSPTPPGLTSTSQAVHRRDAALAARCSGHRCSISRAWSGLQHPELDSTTRSLNRASARRALR